MNRKFFVAVIAVVVVLAGVFALAQNRMPSDLNTAQKTDEVRRPALGHESAVLTGENIGVRLTGSVDAQGRVQGTLIAKVNGRWVDVVAAGNR